MHKRKGPSAAATMRWHRESRTPETRKSAESLVAMAMPTVTPARARGATRDGSNTRRTDAGDKTEQRDSNIVLHIVAVRDDGRIEAVEAQRQKGRAITEHVRAQSASPDRGTR